MAAQLLSLLSLLSLLPLSTSLFTETFLAATETLSDSGFHSMSLTLQFLPKSQLPNSSSLTLFSPPDSIFIHSGQPSLSLLQFHFSPQSLSPNSLKSLKFGSKIQTAFADHSLTVTTPPNNPETSINGVKVNESAIFDDGSLIIFGIEKFFDLNYRVFIPVQSPKPNFICVNVSGGTYSIDEAYGVLGSRGFSVMASFLGMQLLGFQDGTALTVFAPIDEGIMEYFGNFSKYPSIFLRHVVQCKFLWSDLVDLDDGTTLLTYLDGYVINVTKSGQKLMLNGVSVTLPNMYYNEWLVVHGISEVFPVFEKSGEGKVASYSTGINSEENLKVVNLKGLMILIAFCYMLL